MVFKILTNNLTSTYMTRRMIQLLALTVMSAGALSIVPAQQALAGGCTDPYETFGESLMFPGAPVAVPAEVNRSLCGLYDGDYVAFTGESGKTYHIEILNFAYANDLQLTVYADNGTGSYRLVASVWGVSGLDLPATSSERYIVNIVTGQSRLGYYGGGDYVFKLTTVGEVPPEPTPPPVDEIPPAPEPTPPPTEVPTEPTPPPTEVPAEPILTVPL